MTRSRRLARNTAATDIGGLEVSKSRHQRSTLEAKGATGRTPKARSAFALFA